MKNELCRAGELLEQRFDLGIIGIQSDITELKDTCLSMADTLQNIDKSMAHHLGEHEGSEKCAVDAGRKYGIIYGLIGAVISFIVAAATIYKIMPFTGP